MEQKFSKNLAKYRKRRNMTQGQLAATLHVTPQAVSKWENGSLPDPEFLPAIARTLGISLDVLFGLQEERVVPDLEQLIADTIRQTPPESRAELVTQLFYAMMTAYNDYKLSKQKYPENLELETYVELKTDHEGAVARLNDDLRYFCFFQVPEDGIDSYTESTEGMVRVFDALADKDAIDLVHYLGSSYRNRMQSLSFIAKQVDMPLEKVETIMQKLDRLGLVWKVYAEIGEEPSTVYGFSNNTALTCLLIIAKSLSQYLQFHDIYVDTWKRAFFRAQESQSAHSVSQTEASETVHTNPNI